MDTCITYPDVKYCTAIDDGYLCWPPTLAGETTYQRCPETRQSDPNNIAFRICGKNGIWLDRKEQESKPEGWTNYNPCFSPDVRSLLTKVYNREEEAQAKFDIAERTRRLEIVGYSLALITLVLSLVIYSRFRSLRNNRTWIHQNLFSAMTIQVIIRLVLYIDQAFNRGSSNTSFSIENNPSLCIAFYIILEYGGSVTFMWMFIEGYYLHNMVTGNSLRESRSQRLYQVLLGWGLPVIITGVWAIMTHFHYVNQTHILCWYGYNFTWLYLIVHGPRIGIIIINFVFLVNIMRVIIIKLRRTESNELTKIRKTLRAMLVLLPLLGITNILNMIEPPLESVRWFRIWSYSTHFFRSFEGVFVPFVYCFLNAEVRAVLKKYYEDRRAMRHAGARGQSEQKSFDGCCCTRHREQDEVEIGVIAHPDNSRVVLSEVTQLPTVEQQVATVDRAQRPTPTEQRSDELTLIKEIPQQQYNRRLATFNGIDRPLRNQARPPRALRSGVGEPSPRAISFDRH